MSALGGDRLEGSQRLVLAGEGGDEALAQLGSGAALVERAVDHDPLLGEEFLVRGDRAAARRPSPRSSLPAIWAARSRMSSSWLISTW